MSRLPTGRTMPPRKTDLVYGDLDLAVQFAPPKDPKNRYRLYYVDVQQQRHFIWERNPDKAIGRAWLAGTGVFAISLRPNRLDLMALERILTDEELRSLGTPAPQGGPAADRTFTDLAEARAGRPVDKAANLFVVVRREGERSFAWGKTVSEVIGKVALPALQRDQ
jgi:hypothetical protein